MPKVSFFVTAELENCQYLRISYRFPTPGNAFMWLYFKCLREMTGATGRYSGPASLPRLASPGFLRATSKRRLITYWPSM